MLVIYNRIGWGMSFCSTSMDSSSFLFRSKCLWVTTELVVVGAPPWFLPPSLSDLNACELQQNWLRYVIWSISMVSSSSLSCGHATTWLVQAHQLQCVIKQLVSVGKKICTQHGSCDLPFIKYPGLVLILNWTMYGRNLYCLEEHHVMGGVPWKMAVHCEAVASYPGRRKWVRGWG